MPLHRHFLNRDSKLFSEEEEFDIEYPSGKMLSGEDLLSCKSREEFEAALGVTDVAYANYPEDRVEAVHQNIAKE